MKSGFERSWHCCQGKGLTLIEALAALAILGTLLVSALLTEGRCRRQSAGAAARMAACRSADLLLEKWWAEPGSFPRDGGGEVSGGGDFTWRTSDVENEELARLGGELVRLEILPAGASQRVKPLVVVDVVLPRKDEMQGQ